MGKDPRSRFGLVGTAGRVGPLELSTCRSGSLGRSRFVRTLFNPHGSTGRTARTSTLRVVRGLTAAAERAASRLPKSPLTNVSIRHTGSLVRAGDLVFGNSPLFCRFSIPASSSASHSLATGHSSRASFLPLLATRHSPLPPATLPRWLLPSTDNRIAKDRTGP